jgi:hypothetical protein
VEDGWLILNGEYYREMVKKANRQAYQARWQAEKRAKQKMLEGIGKGVPLSGEDAAMKALARGDEGEFNRLSEGAGT